MDDDEADVPSSRIVCSLGGGFGVARDYPTSPIASPATARSSFDWSVLAAPVNASPSTSDAANGSNGGGKAAPLNTFAFLPPFDEDEADTLRTLLRPTSTSISRSPSRVGRSTAPSPETIPRALSSSDGSLSSAALSAPPSPPLAEGPAVGVNQPTVTTVGFNPNPPNRDSASGADDLKGLTTELKGLALGQGLKASGTTVNGKDDPAPPLPVAQPAAAQPAPAPPRATTPPPQARRNTLSLFGLSPRKPRK